MNGSHMDTDEKFLAVLRQLEINPQDLTINSLSWYREKRETLLRSQILLKGEAEGLKANVVNLVITPLVECSTSIEMINIQAAYTALSDYGFELNNTKLQSIHTRFCPPIDCRITIYAERIDCKGANSLLAGYIALEYTCSLLKRRLYQSRRPSPIRLLRCEACNLVVTCQIGFRIPVHDMVTKYGPARCKYKTPEGRSVRRKSKAMFEGAVFNCDLPNGASPRILFQDRAWVTCVACKTYENAKAAIEEFYRAVLAILPPGTRQEIREHRLQQLQQGK